MYILPFTQIPLKASGFEATTLWLFLVNGGTQIWKTDEECSEEEEAVREYLEPNGFRGVSRGVWEDCLLYEVEAEVMKGFYTWTDMLADRENLKYIDVWRPFLLLKDPEYCWKEQTDTLPLAPPFQTLGDLLAVLRQATE